MADDHESSGVGLPSNNDDSDLSKADEREVELLLQYGVAFRRFINEARDIERIYLEQPKRRAEGVRRALKSRDTKGIGLRHVARVYWAQNVG